MATARPAVTPRPKENFSHDQLQAFGKALQAALDARELSQIALARGLGHSQSTISAWCRAEYEPSLPSVLAVEEWLGMRPGTLSRELGFIPVSAADAPPTVEEAIAHSAVDEMSKRVLMGVWFALVENHRKYLQAVGDNGQRVSKPRIRTKSPPRRSGGARP